MQINYRFNQPVKQDSFSRPVSVGAEYTLIESRSQQYILTDSRINPNKKDVKGLQPTQTSIPSTEPQRQKESNQSLTQSSFLYNLPESKLDSKTEISLLKIQNQSLKQTNIKLSNTIQKLHTELQSKVEMLTKFNQLMKIKYNEINQLNQELQNKQLIIKNMEEDQKNLITAQEGQRLKDLIIKKSIQFDQLLNKINNGDSGNEGLKSQVLRGKLQNLLDQLEEQKLKEKNLIIQNGELKQKIREIEEKVEALQFQNKTIKTIEKVDKEVEIIQNLFTLNDQFLESSPSKSPSKSPMKSQKQSQQLQAFEQGLRIQLGHIEELKSILQKKQQVLQSLTDNLITSRYQIQQLHNEIKITELKANSERKKIQMQYRLQLHEKDNLINSQIKKYKTLEDKYNIALKEIKMKDQFVCNHLTGRVNEEEVKNYVLTILKSYRQNFEDLITLKAQNAELGHKLEKYLALQKEIEGSKDMKEKSTNGQNKQVSEQN